MTYTIQELRDKKLIIFEAIAGSQAYGTNTPESDKDIRGVFVQPLNNILKYGFIDQVSDEKNDIVFYELGRFMNLLVANNPNIIELLNLPEDCVIFRHPIFKMLENHKDEFLTKRVRWTFAGYAIDQIQKARGFNKKMNWEENVMTRKTVLDFCYVIENGKTIPLLKWINDYNNEFDENLTFRGIGLVKLNHAQDLYTMYLIDEYENSGIVSDLETANDVQLTSISKEDALMGDDGCLSFNKDGYSSHCKKFKEYQTWLKERNLNRFKMNKEHGKNYDSKNMCHTYRLLSMAHELAKGELRVRRTSEEIEKLMKIRRGEYEYADLLTEAEAMINNLDAAFEASTLPKEVDKEKAYDLLLKMRQYFYSLTSFYKA